MVSRSRTKQQGTTCGRPLDVTVASRPTRASATRRRMASCSTPPDRSPRAPGRRAGEGDSGTTHTRPTTTRRNHAAGAKVAPDRRTREATVRAGTVTSARDEIWIDMIQFDVRAADRLWEGTAPADGAPAWYDDVSGLIETATGPAEPHELVDEPVVVEDMHRTAHGRCSRRHQHRRTVGRVVAMKAAAVTTVGVMGVAAAAAATTGLVATVAGVIAPAIEGHVMITGGAADSGTPATPAPDVALASPDPSLDNPGVALAEAQPAGPVPGVANPGPSARAAGPEPATSVTAGPAEPAIEGVAALAPAPDPAAAPADARSDERAPKDEPPAARPGKSAPRTDQHTTPRADKARPATAGHPGGNACGQGSCSGGNHVGGKGNQGGASAEVVAERAPRGQVGRSG